MVNSRQIGNQSVVACKKYFESLGYPISKVELGGKFTKFKDMFSEWFDNNGFEAGFDMVSISDKEVFFIQVTTTKAKTHKPFQFFAEQFPHITVVQFVRIKGRHPNLLITYSSTEKYIKTEV